MNDRIYDTNKRWQIKVGLEAKVCVPKKPKPIRKVSVKREKQIKQEKLLRGNEETEKQKWFNARRKEMKGICQCGCQCKSSKDDDKNFRSSIAHIFPQKLFPSIRFHKLNWVERAFWGGCHHNMDFTSIERWREFKDFEEIKNKFYELSVLLTDEERKEKFYTLLETLIYK